MSRAEAYFPDARVLARFQAGDPEAVARVYRAYGRLVYAVAYKVLGHRELSEEATQQTFVNAWRAASRIDPERELDGWLVTIARRVAIDIYRRESRRAAVSLEVVSPDDLRLAAPDSTPEECIELWEVRRAVSQLPADERAIVRLQHFEGLTHAEIAERLGLPVGTVKSRSFRAHTRLAAKLGVRETSSAPESTRTGRIRHR
jgi:RNA polymerase sigma factor (sigma-70 family)